MRLLEAAGGAHEAFAKQFRQTKTQKNREAQDVTRISEAYVALGGVGPGTDESKSDGGGVDEEEETKVAVNVKRRSRMAEFF